MAMNRKITKDIDEYLGGCPKDEQRLLTQMRTTIQKAAPQATEKISYGIPTFYRQSSALRRGPKPYWILSNAVGDHRFQKRIGARQVVEGRCAIQPCLYPHLGAWFESSGHSCQNHRAV